MNVFVRVESCALRFPRDVEEEFVFNGVYITLQKVNLKHFDDNLKWARRASLKRASAQLIMARAYTRKGVPILSICTLSKHIPYFQQNRMIELNRMTT